MTLLNRERIKDFLNQSGDLFSEYFGTFIVIIFLVFVIIGSCAVWVYSSHSSDLMKDCMADGKRSYECYSLIHNRGCGR